MSWSRSATGGASPVLARRLREKIEAILPARIGDFAAWMRTLSRSASRTARASAFLASPLLGKRDRRSDRRGVSCRRAAESRKAALLREFETAGASSGIGVVHLVGAGPGDPDLLTLRALQTLQSADVIFYDELVGPEILDRARRDAEQVFVGKRKGAPGIGQDAINRLLLEAAQAGRNVVRLKGGDPFIFGRGGEELEFLQTSGIQVTIVPGITAALGCAAEAGLPLTFRKDATRLTFVTANTAEGADSIDWIRACRSAGDGRRLYGPVVGSVRSKRLDCAPAAIAQRRSRCWRAARVLTSKTATGRLGNLQALAGVGRRGARLARDRRCRRTFVAPGKPRSRNRGRSMTAPQQQKLKVNGPVVVTANRLGDGAVVYRTVGTAMDDAARRGCGRDHRAGRDRAAAGGVSPTTSAPSAPMSRRCISTATSIKPGNLRERIRLAGPTFELPGIIRNLKAHVHLRRFRPHAGRRARRRIPRPGRAPPFRGADARTNSSRCA